MKYSKIPFLLKTFLILNVTLIHAENITDLMNLEKYLVQQNPKKLRPIVNQSEPVTVHVNIFIFSLLQIDHIRQTLEISFLYNITWKDELLAWNPPDYGGIKAFVPETGSIWLPLLSCYNCLEMNIFQDEQSPVTIYHDGLVVWQPRKNFEVFCNIKVAFFPFDKQICPINFFPMKHSCFEVMLKKVSNSVDRSFYITNGEWDMKYAKVKSVVCKTSKSFLEVTLTMERRPLYFLLNVISPILLLSFLNLFTFCLPDDSGEKILFSLTMLLSQTVFLSTISSSLPATSVEIVYITNYITSLLLNSCLITIASITLLYFHYKRKKQGRKKENENQENKCEEAKIKEASPNTQGIYGKYDHIAEGQVSKGQESSSGQGVVSNTNKKSTFKSFKPNGKKCCNCTIDMFIFCLSFIIWGGLTGIFLLTIIFKNFHIKIKED